MVQKGKKNTDQEMDKNNIDNIKEPTEQKNQEEATSGTDKGEGTANEKAETVKEDKKRKSKRRSKSSKEDELKAQIGELNDKYLRLYSEFDNYRRRTSKEKIELTKTAAEDLIVELLPIMDDFDRAIKSAEETKDCDAVKEGMELIYNKLNGILTRKGLAEIEAMGKEFDTDFHEAISYIPSPSDDMKGKVIDAVEKGYTLGDKVIRYSKVVIGQ